MVVGYVVSEAVVGTVIAGITVSTLGAAVIGGVASLATSAVMKSAMGGNDPGPAALLNQTGAARTVQFRQPTPPHEWVVGRIRKSGPVMFMHSGPDDDGRTDGYFYIQIALAAHHCRAIGDVYLDGNLSTGAGYSGLVYSGKHLGTDDQVEDAIFLSDLGSGVFGDHWLRGRANIAVRLKASRDVFPNGVPNISAMVWGADNIDDPRTGDTGWTNNAILILRWWMIEGEGYDAEDFDEDALIEAANICDERVRVLPETCEFTADAATDALTLAAGGRVLDVGDGVRVSSSSVLPAGWSANTTYYVYPFDDGSFKLCATVADAFAGDGVAISTAGSGTHTLTYWDEARYKCNGSFNLDAEKRDIRDQLLTACSGYAIEIGGMWFLHAAAAATPSVTLTVDDLRGDMVTVPKRSLRDRINGARAVFVNADNNWQPSDAPPRLNSGYVVEDGGAELYATLRFPFTVSARQVQRQMKIAIELNRQQSQVKFPAKLTAMRLRPLDGVYVTDELYQWAAKQHIVLGWVLADDGGIDLLLQEDTADVYAWDATEESGVSIAQGVTLPDPSTIAAPAALTVTTPTDPTYSSLTFDIDPVLSIWLDGYAVEFRASGDTDWSTQPLSEDATIEVVTAVATDFRVRAVTFNKSVSSYTENLAPGMPASAGHTGTTLTWTNDADADLVQIFKGATNDFAASTLFDTVDGADESAAVDDNAYYWLRSVNADGNISAQTATITVGSP